jgi:hypothetical protein
VFDDVTLGSNDVFPFVGGSPLGCCAAVPGFDDASGWGSVNVANFAQQALAFQPQIIRVSLSLPGHQRPLSARAISSTVSCSGPCVLAAFALVKIGGAKPFEVDSKLATLTAAGSKTVQLKFSRKELGKLRSGRKHHERITAAVSGVVFNHTVLGLIGAPGESVQAQTGAKHLTI